MCLDLVIGPSFIIEIVINWLKFTTNATEKDRSKTNLLKLLKCLPVIDYILIEKLDFHIFISELLINVYYKFFIKIFFAYAFG